MVDLVGDAWDRPSPCPGWDARGVVEHVIGFHDVLVLRPLGAKPHRPKDDPSARWAVTVPAIFSALRARWVGVGTPGGPLDLDALLPMLTTDVLVHTWDLSRAVDLEVALDPALCEAALDGARRSADRLRSSGMFGPPITAPEGSRVQTALIAFLGRDPSWGRV